MPKSSAGQHWGNHPVKYTNVMCFDLAAAAKELGKVGFSSVDSPNFSVEGWRQRLPQKDPERLERLLAALRKAGIK